MAIYFKCPHCNKPVADCQGECTLDYEKGLFECPECKGVLTLDDVIDYETFIKDE